MRQEMFAFVYILNSVKVFCNAECWNNPCSCCKSGECAIPGDKTFSCNGCIDGYTRHNCIEPCPDHCVSCSQYVFENNDRTCYICKNGFYNGRYRDYLDPPLSDCSLSCRDNCEICTSYVNCKLCKTGHYLSSEKECKKCPKYCANCSSAIHCLQCEDGYFKDIDACQECSPGCKTCLSKSHCTSCDDGCFLEMNECKQCRSVCINCLSDIYCQLCANGYWGTMCEYSCTWNCRNNVCDIHNGTCIHGFTDDSRKTKEEGYFENNVVKSPDGKYLAIIIVLGSALGLVLVLIIVWKIFVMKRKKRKRNRGNYNEVSMDSAEDTNNFEMNHMESRIQNGPMNYENTDLADEHQNWLYLTKKRLLSSLNESNESEA